MTPTPDEMKCLRMRANGEGFIPPELHDAYSACIAKGWIYYDEREGHYGWKLTASGRQIIEREPTQGK